ncbi:MAG: glycosyltransferase family 2 protein [bacterium]
MNPTISIIVPVYNVEKYLGECLDSILQQTYPHLQIICVDDGSADSSGKILDEYAQNDSRIVVIHQKN